VIRAAPDVLFRTPISFPKAKMWSTGEASAPKTRSLVCIPNNHGDRNWLCYYPFIHKKNTYPIKTAFTAEHVGHLTGPLQVGQNGLRDQRLRDMLPHLYRHLATIPTIFTCYLRKHELRGPNSWSGHYHRSHRLVYLGPQTILCSNE
jgi:hypothetical protein